MTRERTFPLSFYWETAKHRVFPRTLDDIPLPSTEERPLMPTLSHPTLIVLRGSATLAFAAGIAAAVSVACSSSNPGVDAGPRMEVCPSSVTQAVTAPGPDAGEGYSSACHVDGYVCAVGIICTNFLQQVECTCSLLPSSTANNPVYGFVCDVAATQQYIDGGSIVGADGGPESHRALPIRRHARRGSGVPRQ